jgi:hypothetical protein
MKPSPQWIYEQVYCQRGEIENRIKELNALDVDRTSCTNFWTNQLAVLMTAAAYVLMPEIRLAAALTAMARAQVWTLRGRLLKLAFASLPRCGAWCSTCPSPSPSYATSGKWLRRWEPLLDKANLHQSTTEFSPRQKHCQGRRVQKRPLRRPTSSRLLSAVASQTGEDEVTSESSPSHANRAVSARS